MMKKKSIRRSDARKERAENEKIKAGSRDKIFKILQETA